MNYMDYYRLEEGTVHLGAEAWPAGLRGQPKGLWVSRPRRRAQWVLFTVLVALCLSFGAFYLIEQVPGLALSPLALAFQS